jgi:hypothetical protein
MISTHRTSAGSQRRPVRRGVAPTRSIGTGTAHTSPLAVLPRVERPGHRPSSRSNRRSRRLCAIGWSGKSGLSPRRSKRPPGPTRPWPPRTLSPRLTAGSSRLPSRHGWRSWWKVQRMGRQVRRRIQPAGQQCRGMAYRQSRPHAERTTPIPRPRAPPVCLVAAVPDLRAAAFGRPSPTLCAATRHWAPCQR